MKRAVRPVISTFPLGMIRAALPVALLAALAIIGGTGVGLAQTTTTAPTTTTIAPPAEEGDSTPYGPRVLGEQINPPPPPPSPNIPETGSPSAMSRITDGMLASWYGLPLWSQAAVVSGMIALGGLALVGLLRHIADLLLGERR